MSQEFEQTGQTRERVGVYLDFDNIVISRYNQLYGEGAFARDKVRNRITYKPSADVTARIHHAMVDVDAILDYAATLGPIVVSRAYADWSTAVNARHQRQLVDRAVDLVQLFPVVAALKNGADIRLAIDVMEDLFRLDDLTHIVIVAGDSDYIPLAQRCRRLGRVVVGIGVSGSTSSALASACDVFADYDSIPGTVRGTPIAPTAAGSISAVAGATKVAAKTATKTVPKAGAVKTGAVAKAVTKAPPAKAATKAVTKAPAAKTTATKPAAAKPVPAGVKAAAVKAAAVKPAGVKAAGTITPTAAKPAVTTKAKTAAAALVQPTTKGSGSVTTEKPAASPKARKAATALLLRAMEHLAPNNLEWQHASTLKSTMRQLDPTFQESSLGFSQFGEFLKSRHQTVEIQERTGADPILLKLRS